MTPSLSVHPWSFLPWTTPWQSSEGIFCWRRVMIDGKSLDGVTGVYLLVLKVVALKPTPAMISG